jgi:co-chaperonin GroES (HSP10)
MSENTNQKSMMLVVQDHRGMPTFSMIRTNETCPFVECIYVPDQKQLAIISTVQKDTFHLFPKLDDNGDTAIAKGRKVVGKNYKEERKAIKTFYEYTLVNEDDIIAFVEKFADNADTFPFRNVINPEAARAKAKK